MSLARRRFIKKSLLGVLSVSLLPASISFLKRDYLFSVDEIFGRLSFKKTIIL